MPVWYPSATHTPTRVPGFVARELRPYWPGAGISSLSVGDLIASGTETASDSALELTVSTACATGNLCVLYIALDNASSSTPTISSVTDSRSNTWTQVGYGIRPIAAGSGNVGVIFKSSINTAALQVGDTITVNLSNAVASKAGFVEVYPGFTTTEPAAAVVAQGSASSLSVGPITPTASGQLVVGMMSLESNADPSATDSDTTDGSWSSLRIVKADTGTSTTSVEVGRQYKIVTGTSGQNLNWTMAVSTDAVAIEAVFSP